MLRGIAKAGGDDTPEDRYGIVVALSNLSKTLSSEESSVTFSSAVETCATLLRVSAVVLWLWQEDKLVEGASIGVNGNATIISGSQEIAGISVFSSAPVVRADVRAESGLGERELASADIASVLSVPMRVGNANVGAIVVMSNEPRTFSPSDVELLHVIASQAALAAWKSNTTPTSAKACSDGQNDLIQLANRKIQELSLVNQIAEAISSTLDMDKLLTIALDQSMAAVGADAGSLMLISEETNRLEIAASRGIAKKWVERTSQSVGSSVAGWVAEHGESVLVTDARRDARFTMPFFRDDITSAASIPLKARGNVIGVLNVNTARPEKYFDERDLEFLGTIASQVATAIDNARLYARVNRRTKQLDGLLQISRTITSTLNLDEVMQRLSTEICKLYALDVCVILISDELSGRLRFGYGSGLKTRRKSTYFDLAAPLASKVGITGKKIVLRDITASSSLCTELHITEQLKGAVCIPLKAEGHVVGFAAGFSREPKIFPKSQTGIMRPLGELAAVAIRNARVYRRKYKMAQLLQQRLVPTDLPQIDGLDLGYKFLPAREVGGDYYDFMNLGSGKIGIVLADVSGSDVEAAEFTTMGKHVLRAYAHQSVSPAEVLTLTNDLICEDTRAEIFISLFYGVIDLNKRTLSYASAGCEPAIIYRSADEKASALTADGMLLGIMKGAGYEERTISLSSGDVLALYTDGLTEACHNKRRFGASAVMDLIQKNAGSSAQGIADSLHDALLEFVHGRVTDDVAMVLLKMP